MRISSMVTMGGFCLLSFPVKGMISMAVLFAERDLKCIQPYPRNEGQSYCTEIGCVMTAKRGGLGKARPVT